MRLTRERRIEIAATAADETVGRMPLVDADVLDDLTDDQRVQVMHRAREMITQENARFSGTAVVSAPHLTAGIHFRRGRVARVHERFRYMEGWTYEELERWVDRHGWDVIKLKETV